MSQNFRGFGLVQGEATHGYARGFVSGGLIVGFELTGVESEHL